MNPKRYSPILALALLGWLFSVTLGTAAAPMPTSAIHMSTDIPEEVVFMSDAAHSSESGSCCGETATLTTCELVCSASALQSTAQSETATGRAAMHLFPPRYWLSWHPDPQSPPPDLQSA